MNKVIQEKSGADGEIVIVKTAALSPLESSDEDLSKINKYTLSPVQAEDVFIFKATLADNNTDDRNNMPFSIKALQDLQKLYIGKTLLKDHERRADNQIGRVFDTELRQNKSGTHGEPVTELPVTELIAKIYMIRTASNADLIAEIKGGIKKEVSTSCTPAKMICNICGCDNLKDMCVHHAGVDYDVTDTATGKLEKKKCQMLLDGAKDAYEVSFVAVPAQPRAGTYKSVGREENILSNKRVAEINLKIRFSETLLFNRLKDSGGIQTMNKKMRELFTQIQEKTAEAKGLMEGENKDVDKATAIMNEADALRKEYEIAERIFNAEKVQGVESADSHSGSGDDVASKAATGTEIIAKEVRAIMAPNKYAADKALVESVDENGGYTVPEDIQTKVQHWPEIVYSFLDDISVEPVSTNKGARTYQTKADTDAFIDLDENGAITNEITAPTFERVTYSIQDRAGFMPVSNDLMNDSDANISAIVTEWLGRANIATANAKILAIIQAKEQVAIDGIDGIKSIVNVTLGQAYKGAAKIITNDDGLNYLDTLKDENGRYLLNPDPTDSTKLQLRCGATVVPIKVVPNSAFPTSGTQIPVVIGDLKAGIRKFDRQSMSLKASDVATIGDFNAFAMNMTLIRAILRDDYKELDSDAYVYGYIDTAASETDAG